MRFFKAFNILHRRTKSATFVPGPSLDLLTSPNARNSSLRYKIPNDALSSTIFDMATAEVPSIPPQFNHLAARLPNFWNTRRHSDRTSASNSPLVDKDSESARLKEGINFWISQHSKLQLVLDECHAEMMTARQKILTLEYKLEQDAQVISNLRSRLANHGNLAQLRSGPSTKPTYTDICPTPAALSTSGTLSAVRPLTKAPTAEEYSNALRLTLATRKELRDQRKVTKFWKRQASLTIGVQHDLITPSASAISSIHEKIPAERQAALETLIMQRGLSSVLTNTHSSGQVSAFTEVDNQQRSLSSALPTVTFNLPASDSKGSLGPRLAPLASESLKAEINSMFGSRSSIKKLAHYTGKPRDGPSAFLHASGSSTSVVAGCSTDSVSLSGRVGRKFEGIDTVGAGSLSDSLLEGLPSMPTSLQQISALPSGTSEIFAQQTTASLHTNNEKHPTIKQASKDCTSHRSWQYYTLSKSSTANKNPTEPLIIRKSKLSAEDKENRAPLHTTQWRQSRLPVSTLLISNHEGGRQSYSLD